MDGLPTMGIAMREHGPYVDFGNEMSARVSRKRKLSKRASR